MKSEILYLSTLIPDDEFNRIILLDKSPQIATHVFQWKVFKGIKLSQFTTFDFHIISTRPISEYPRNRTKIVASKNWETQYGKLHELFFINYPVIKTITIFISCFLECFKWSLYKRQRIKKGVFIDSYQLPYLICGHLISRIFKIPLIGLLTDPPNMNYKISWESSFKSRFRHINGFMSVYLINTFSGVIALTQFLADDYCPQKKYLIIEAIAENRDQNYNAIKTEKFVLLYSGSLLKVYGIITLIKAFISLPNPDLELWIFGRGDAEKEINDFAAKDTRIKYFGFKEYKEILYFQSISNLLLNPRPTDLPDSKYSFPSKILEYMQSGTPSLITRLPGIPSEYDEYVFYIDVYNELNIANRINDIYNMDRDQLISFGKKAQVFANTKNIEKQGDRIAKFIQEIMN